MDSEHYENVPSLEGPVIAMGTPLEMQIDGISERVCGILVGTLAGECLIIRGQFDSLEGQAIEGSKVTVRYIHEGAVKAFTSKWLGAIATPVELAFITHPKAIETLQLRTHKRVECFLSAELIIRNEIYSGTIQDVSESGCKFILDVSGGRESPAIGESERVILAVHIPEAGEKFEILGEARSVRVAADFDGEEMHVGIQVPVEQGESLKRIAESVSAVEVF